MQTLKFKDKVKKKVKEFLAVTLISSSILVSNVGCDNGDDGSVYGNSDYVVVDNDTTEKPDKNDTKPVDDEKQDEEEEDNDLIDDGDFDNDILTNDEEQDEVDDEIEDEDVVPTNVNTGDKYVVSSIEIEEEYKKDCFDYIKLAKLIAEHCQSASEIDVSTPSGKCHVPSYMTGNAQVQATTSCNVYLFMKSIDNLIKNGYVETNPDAFYGKVWGLNHYLIYSYLIQKNYVQENLRNIVTYPQDEVSDEYLFSDYQNGLDFGLVSYRMLNEHTQDLLEMEFISNSTDKHTRIRMYPAQLEELGRYSFFVLDLLKCPELDGNEISLGKFLFLPEDTIIENDPKYKRFIDGECDAYYDQITQEYIDELKGN
jgi:hypothetical protein